MRMTLGIIVMLILSLSAAVLAQPPPPAQPAEEKAQQELAEVREILMGMGMDEGQATVFSLMLTSGTDDASSMLPLLMMMDRGGGGGDAMGFMMLLKAMSGAKAPPQPIFWPDTQSQIGYIVDEGVLYRIDLRTMQVAGKVPYKDKQGRNVVALLRAMTPAIGGAREQAQQASCMSNMKQLALGALMYAKDHGQLLPSETWVADTMPYTKNAAIYKCPSRPELRTGYAINKLIAGADIQGIAEPAKTILYFESNVGGDNPIGGPEDVPEGGVHNGGINCAFVDRHCKWIPVDRAKEILGEPPF